MRRARLKARAREIDPAWPVIRLLKALRLADYSENALARFEPRQQMKTAA